MATTEVKYPEIKARLTGRDGNAFSILGRVKKALKRGGVDEAEIKKFMAEATNGDYSHLLATCMKWVDVD